jgi:hypothetical protein
VLLSGRVFGTNAIQRLDAVLVLMSYLLIEGGRKRLHSALK